MMIKKTYIFIGLYLSAIIAANLLVVQFGPAISVVNAFLFIGLDLTTRDYLHEMWQGRNLWRKMLILIASGSILSYLLNANAGIIAIASFSAFAIAGVVDTISYAILGQKSRLIRINGSNIFSAGADSIVFPLIAFGWPLLIWVVIGQFLAKVIGGFIWSMIINNLQFRRSIG